MSEKPQRLFSGMHIHEYAHSGKKIVKPKKLIKKPKG